MQGPADFFEHRLLLHLTGVMFCHRLMETADLQKFKEGEGNGLELGPEEQILQSMRCSPRQSKIEKFSYELKSFSLRDSFS